jgi:probable F420-dependent oxidoreductase
MSLVRLGVTFPQIETTGDADAVDEFLAGVSEAGFDHLVAYDHVIGADPAGHDEWSGAYDVDDPFHEPLTLFSYAAAKTSLELMTAVIVLPQRQTVLLARQAAELDLLSRGRLRLGVGIGWNKVEYEALGQNFASRGRRFEEQVGLLRRLWTERSVDFRGEFDVVSSAGLLPLPIQKPIPLWFAVGSSHVALERAARLADGIMPRWLPGPEMAAAMDHLRSSIRAAGRDPGEVGVQGRIPVGGCDRSTIRERAAEWSGYGLTHLAVDTMGAGLRFPDEHVAAARAAAEALRDADVMLRT